MNSILSITKLNKIYDGAHLSGRQGFQALKDVNLEIQKGEIFALLGPNGAGKTTLISSVCGIVNPTSGQILVDGKDVIADFKSARSLIGLVPQELSVEMFEPIWHTVRFSRGLFGLPPNDDYCAEILKKLSLWDKHKNQIRTLSGGMKRRVMIAKALSHEPKLLFLDEPTAGVDVELRKDMWAQVKELQDMGVTIILTTHYIEEAEEMADRIGVISKGEIIVVEKKKDLMKKFGRKQLIVDLKNSLEHIPSDLSKWNLTLKDKSDQLIYEYDSSKEDNGIAELLADFCANNIHYKDIHTDQSSLEEIFIELVNK